MSETLGKAYGYRLVMTAVAVALLSVAMLATSAKARGDQGAAENVAKRVASNYVEKFGIFYPASSWKASCHEKGRKWKCAVKTDTGQCSGTVRLRERRSGGFKAYKKNIGCGE